MRPSYYDSKDRLAGAMPSAALNERFSARGSLHAQFVSGEGYIALHSWDCEEGLVCLPTMQEAFDGWLEAHGIKSCGVRRRSGRGSTHRRRGRIE